MADGHDKAGRAGEWPRAGGPVPGAPGPDALTRANEALASKEAALLASEAKYRSLFESIDEGFCIIEVLFDGASEPVDYRFLEVSPSFTRQTGLADAAGRRMRELAPGHEEHWFRIYGRIAVTGEPARFQERAAELRRWYDVYAWRYGRPGDRQVAILFNDITERKESERALADSERRLSTILQATPALVYFVDRDGRFLHINRAFEEVIGRSADEVRGRSLFEVFPSGIASEFGAHNEAVMAAGRAMEFEETADLPEGRRSFTSIKAPIAGADGRPMGIVGVSTDVTERRRLEAELRRHREHLETLVAERTAELESSQQRLRLSERMSALGTLSAGLGHDMRNLLMPMRAWIGELMETPLPEGAARAVRSLARATEYLGNLSAGLRSLSVDLGTDASTARTDLEAWWRDASVICRATLPRGVSLHAAGLEGLPPVAVSNAALTQAAFNLVQNAGDAMRERGSGNVWLEAAAAPGGVRLVVRDDGPGMDEQTRVRCMEPFFTTKVRGRGTGLGLSIVHGVLEASGATMDIESEPGRGSAFTLTLPAAADPPAERPTAAVTLADPRMSAIAQRVLLGLGVEAAAHSAGTPPGADLWVVDAAVPEAQLRRFIDDSGGAGAPAPRVVRFGEPLGLGPSVLEAGPARASEVRLILARIVTGESETAHGDVRRAQ